MRISYQYDEYEVGSFFHTFRYMTLNGYEGVERQRYGSPDHICSFEESVEELLGFHRQQGYDDEDYFNGLALPLMIMGPRLRGHHRVNEIADFLGYISTEYAKDARLHYLDPALFAMLLHDMAFPPERARAAFEHFVLKAGNHSPMFFPAWWYGYRIFGPGILPVLRRVKVALGWDLLEPIITEDSGL